MKNNWNNQEKIGDNTVICPNCGGTYSIEEPKCPFCGTLNPVGAEKEYMGKLRDIEEDTGRLADDVIEWE